MPLVSTIDSYSESNQNAQGGVRSGFSGDGQSFTCGVTDFHITSAKFYIKKSGTPTGNITVELYAHTGTYGTSSAPTGSALATSDAISITTLTTSFVLTEFTFTGSQRYKMISTIKYFLAIRFSGGDASNQLLTGSDDTSPTHDGNRAWLTDPSTWTVAAGTDVCFYVYGIPSFITNNHQFASSVSAGIISVTEKIK